ncbi:SEC14 cytosolic factor [Nymphaea thermarum]|nr:SEC14 cytosolic factor [Nymphaea thermarum]
MEEAQLKAVREMRAAVERLNSSTQGEEEANLVRFLVARSMDPSKAAKMFAQWRKWRAEIAPLGHILDDEVADQLNARKINLQGVTKSGHSMIVFLARLHFPSKDRLQFKKFVAHVLDKAVASASEHVEKGKERIVCVVDLQQFSIANIDVLSIRAAFQILQDYYPERLAKLYIMNMPRILIGIWRMLSKFLDKATLEKIAMVSSKEEKMEMVKEIGEEILPVEYGGSAKLVPLQDAKLKD